MLALNFARKGHSRKWHICYHNVKFSTYTVCTFSLYQLCSFLHSRFDSTLNEILDPEFASVESKMDSRIQSNVVVFFSQLSGDVAKILALKELL